MKQFLAVSQVIMYLLLFWSVGNVLIGGTLRWFLKGFWRSFWDMSVVWCLVNVVIAVVAIMGVGNVTEADLVHVANSIHFNAGLNFAYVASGVAIWMYGKWRDRVSFGGYGVAIIAQGLVLMAIDFSLIFFAL
jgi:hypothetical protein